MHDPRAVANRILDIAEERGKALTLMQLIKMIYLAHGWALAVKEKPLVSEPVQAWQYGPVYPSVYHSFSGARGFPVETRASIPGTDVAFSEPFTEDEDRLLAAIVKHYGKFHAFDLSEMTHVSGTPWSTTKETEGLYAKIPDDMIKEYFKKVRMGEVSGRSA